ncbi:MAG: ECF transporter S component [Ruminococcaceae bacterium]|nr:ECF transporter S component [Oscillospiraceae bacterium]
MLLRCEGNGVNERNRKLTYAALYLAIALVLPFITGQIPEIGAMLSPMHIPVLLCGFVCGWQWGMVVGLIAPLLRSALFGMPTLYPAAIAMTFELAAYGALSGILYRLLPRKTWSIYASLILAMIGGRLVWGAARYALAGLSGSEFPLSAFFAGAVLNAIPGIILHIVLIPVLVIVLEKARLTLR